MLAVAQQPAQATGIGRQTVEVGPEDIVESQVRLAFPGAAIPDGVEHRVGIDQVVAAHQMPVEEPLYLVQGEPPAVRAADLGEDAAGPAEAAPTGGGFGSDAAGTFQS